MEMEREEMKYTSQFSFDYKETKQLSKQKFS